MDYEDIIILIGWIMICSAGVGFAILGH